MNPRIVRILALRLCAVLLFAGTLVGAALAQTAGTGTIQGRVLNITSGSYLNNARVTVEGTSLQTFTDEFGEYMLTGVPAGTASVRAFYTGLEPQTAVVSVAAGGTATRDFNLTRPELGGKKDGDLIVLDAFVVASAKETNASDIAINEQRFAPNMKNVVAADEFGSMTEGNVGEFLKFLPGVALEYTAADARSVSIRGMPPVSTPVMLDGNPVANSGAGTSSRIFEFDQLSINNVSRIEVTKGPTPESPASAIGGTVNLIPKSAFERSKSEFNYRVFLNMNHQEQQDVQYLSLKSTAGPGERNSVKVKPGFDFTWVHPLSKTFGYTVTGLYSSIFNQQYTTSMRWTPTHNNGSQGTLANPVMNSYNFNDGPKNTERYSMGVTFDKKLSPRDVIGFGASWNAFTAFFNNHSMITTIGTGAANLDSYNQTYTQGKSGGSFQQQPSSRDADRRTWSLNLKYRHTGPVWKMDGAVYASDSRSLFRDMELGHFNTSRLALSSLAVRYDDITRDGPTRLSAKTTTGVEVDPTRIDNYTLGLVNTNWAEGNNRASGAKFNISRFFDVWSLPVEVKVGADARRAESEAYRPFRQWTFVGPDKVPGSADDRAGLYDLVDVRNSSIDAPYGRGNWQWISSWKSYQLYQQHPEWFRHDDVYQIQQRVVNSNVVTEDIISEYVRLDLRLFDNKLWIVTGVRHEQTIDEGDGPINDVSRTYLRDASGNFVRDSAGKLVKASTDPIALANMQYVERGAHIKKDYGDFYPSVNATYNVRPNLIGRFAYSNTISRPNYSNILPGVTLPDPNTTSRTIMINNINLKPWSSKNYDLSVSYYPSWGGHATVGVFRKDIQDFFGTRTVDATAELLDQYGIDDSYANGEYLVSYLMNVGQARIQGWEFDYRQPLNKLVPTWARGLSLRYNVTRLTLDGNTGSDFSSFIRKNMNWGVSFERPKYSVRMNWNYRGRQRQTLITGVAEALTYQYMAPRLTMDVDAEYRVSRGLGFFAAARNITGQPFVVERFGPNTPDYARRYQRNDYGVAITLGVRGSF